MRIGILSRNRSLYSTRRLVQAARLRGHRVNVIDTLKIPVNVGGQLRTSPYKKLPDVEAIIPRIGTSITFYGLAVVRQFEKNGVITTASSAAISRSRDKLHSLQTMSGAGLPIPITTVVANVEDIFTAIQNAGGLPVIIKLIRGTQGRGVFLAKEMHIVESLLNAVRKMREQMLIQEYISESRGKDLRIIVVGNRCVAAMERTAAKGDFRANLHRGGTARSISLDEATEKQAVLAAHAHGLSVAGVDMVQSNRGPLLLEVNSSPGLEGIEKTTRTDIGTDIIRLIEREEKRSRPKRKRGRRVSRK
jgi:ribosomal protein S6--L-glutamate ligase